MKLDFYFLYLASSISLSVFAQDIDSAKEIRDGDLLSKRRIAYESIQIGPSNDFILDLRTADILHDQYDVFYRKISNNTVIGYENEARTYYRQTSNELLISGYEDRFSKILYDIPETWLYFSMQKDDSISGYFHGSGDYCHQLYMRSMGKYKTIAEGHGILILANGDTLRHVVRLRTDRVTTTCLYPMESIISEYGNTCHAPVFTTDSIIKHMELDTVPVRSIHYRWYANGYRYPILETIVIDVNEPQLTTAFYYPPEEQLSLSLDEQNLIVREEISKNMEDGVNNSNNRNLTYQFIHQENEHKLTINYTLQKPTMVKLLLCNIQGIVCQHIEQHGTGTNNSISMNYGSLRPGQYVLYILADQEKYIEKLHIK